MDKIHEYQTILRNLSVWDTYLLQESRLPGPRANLELAYAAASLASNEQITAWLSVDHQAAPTNTPGEFLAVCGTIALGYQLIRGNSDSAAWVIKQANDPRWRIRESVAIALQIFGDHDMDHMVKIAWSLARGSLYEQRAAAAAICEPRLIQRPEYAHVALEILDEITDHIPQIDNRKSDDFQALRKGLAYCWSVAIAALPCVGKETFSRWFGYVDKDIRWIVKENLKKHRMMKVDPEWANQSLELFD